MKMNSKLYDILSWVGKIVLPALAVFYKTFAGVWNLPYSNEISETIMALDLFLNSLLGLSSANYYKSELNKSEENKNVALEESLDTHNYGENNE